MLQELLKEITLLLEEKEANSIQIAELKEENEKMKAAIEPLNIQIANLQAELEVKIKDVEDKDNLLVEQAKEIEAKNIKIAELQEQVDLKLDEVKAIVEELKGLIANA